LENLGEPLPRAVESLLGRRNRNAYRIGDFRRGQLFPGSQQQDLLIGSLETSYRGDDLLVLGPAYYLHVG